MSPAHSTCLSACANRDPPCPKKLRCPAQDNNAGLLKQCVACLHKRSVHKLTQTYLTLGLADLAAAANLDSAREASPVAQDRCPGCGACFRTRASSLSTACPHCACGGRSEAHLWGLT